MPHFLRLPPFLPMDASSTLLYLALHPLSHIPLCYRFNSLAACSTNLVLPVLYDALSSHFLAMFYVPSALYLSIFVHDNSTLLTTKWINLSTVILMLSVCWDQ